MFYYLSAGGQWGFDYGGSKTRWEVSGVGMLDVCEVAYLQNKVVINDKSYAFPSRTFTSPFTIYLFACNTGGTVELESIGAMKIWYCKLYEDSVLKHDFIPVIDLEGVPCFYDKITKKFFYNKGTGQFIAGPKTGSAGGISSVERDILVTERDCSTGQTLEETGRFTSTYNGSVYTLYIDFTFLGNNADMATGHSNNLMCIGINPNSWNDTSVRVYLGDDDDNSLTNMAIVPFVGVDKAKYDTPLVIGRNKMIIKIDYPIKTEKNKPGGNLFPITYVYNDYTAPKTSIWLNGQAICTDFTPSDALKQEYVSGGIVGGTGWSPDEGYTSGNWNGIIGEITLSNVEGANRFYGIYHEISHILETLTNEELLALTV